MRQFADEIDLRRMVPSRNAASSGFCLHDPGREYLIYLPAGGKVAIHVGALIRSFNVVWFNPNTGVRMNDAPSVSSTTWSLTSPFGAADCVLHLKSRGTDDQKSK